MNLEKAIEKLENTYRAMLNGDFTPEEEARARVQMLSFLSTIRAAALASTGVTAESLADKTEHIKNLLIAFDPYGPWFREVNELVDGIYDLITTAKTIKLEETIHRPPIDLDAKLNELNQNLEKLSLTVSSEVSTLRNELDSLRHLVSRIAKAVPQDQVSLEEEPLERFTESPPVESETEPVKKPPVDETPEEESDIIQELSQTEEQPVVISGEEGIGEDNFRELVGLERKRYLLEKNLENLEASVRKGSITEHDRKKISDELKEQLDEVLKEIEKIQKRLKNAE